MSGRSELRRLATGEICMLHTFCPNAFDDDECDDEYSHSRSRDEEDVEEWAYMECLECGHDFDVPDLGVSEDDARRLFIEHIDSGRCTRRWPQHKYPRLDDEYRELLAARTYEFDEYQVWER